MSPRSMRRRRRRGDATLRAAREPPRWTRRARRTAAPAHFRASRSSHTLASLLDRGQRFVGVLRAVGDRTRQRRTRMVGVRFDCGDPPRPRLDAQRHLAAEHDPQRRRIGTASRGLLGDSGCRRLRSHRRGPRRRSVVGQQRRQRGGRELELEARRRSSCSGTTGVAGTTTLLRRNSTTAVWANAFRASLSRRTHEKVSSRIPTTSSAAS